MRNPLPRQTRYPMMDEQDLNGDGIPDGANVSIRRTATDPETGHTTVASASWRKKPTNERRPMENVSGDTGGIISSASPVSANERRPMEDVSSDSGGLPPAPAPVAADKQMPNGAPAPQGGSAWDQFKRRDARASDLMLGPGRRTDVGTIPENQADVRNYFTRRESDLSVSPTVRAAAGRRLQMMDVNAGRAADLASSERRTLYNAHGEQAKAGAVLEGKKEIAGAMRYQGDSGVKGKLGAAQINADKEIAKQEEITNRDITVKTLMKNGDWAIANTYALAGITKTEIQGETDRVVAELHRQGDVGRAKALANVKGFVDPKLLEFASPAQRDKLIEIGEKAKAAQTETVPPPNAEGLATVKGEVADLVRMRSPTGTERMVPRSQIEKYQGRGAKIVQ